MRGELDLTEEEFSRELANETRNVVRRGDEYHVRHNLPAPVNPSGGSQRETPTTPTSSRHFRPETPDESHFMDQAEQTPGVDGHLLYMYLKKLGLAIKLICIIDFFFGIFRLFTPNGAWWLGMSVVFAPMGFYGAFRFRRLWTLLYVLYCVVQVFLLAAYVTIWAETGLAGILFAVQALLEAFVAYYCWQFYRRLPPA